MTQIDGLDISHHQGEVDFQRLKAGGCNFIFLKATEGVSFTDNKFASNRRAAKAAGIPSGAYHYFSADVSPAAQAAHFVDIVGSVEPGELFPVVDVEDELQFKGISPKRAADMVVAWMEEVEKRLGVPCMLYADESMIVHALGSDIRLAQAGRLLWYAKYRSRLLVPPTPPPFERITVWQFSKTGKRAGIVGNVDEDIAFVPVEDFMRK